MRHPRKTPLAAASATPSGEGQARLSKRDGKRLRWEAQMSEVERGRRPR